MKKTIVVPCLLAFVGTASAALTFTPSFAGFAIHTHSNSDSVVGFDRASDGNLYYATSTPSFTSGGLFRKDGAASTEVVAGSASLFAGNSVVAIGSEVHFNDSSSSSQFIRTFDTITSMTRSSTVTNYALGTDGTNLFTTGSSDFITTNLVYYAGGILGAGTTLGGIPGSSGPVAIDGAGNLFYAPGFGDLGIYRWAAAQVAAAILGGTPLGTGGSLFADYSSVYSTMSGATSLAVDAEGNLFATLTNFADPSLLIRYNATGTASQLVAESTDRLGGLNFRDGQLFVASGNRIFAVIPEPSTALPPLLAVLCLLIRRRR